MILRHARKILRNIKELRLVGRILINNIIIATRLERYVRKINNRWVNFKPDPQKSLQENVGFAHTKNVEEALKKAHADLKRITKKYLSPGDRVLDIGFGAGLYLKDFGNDYILTGLDLSSEMIKLAEKDLFGVKFIIGDFMDVGFDEKFNLIYSISVLEFICRTDLDAFFRKVKNLLEPGGILFIHYPHALSFIHTLYPDLKYIHYSPALIERKARKYFQIIEHHHAFDGRVVAKYDPITYPSQYGTFKNGYLLVARRNMQ